MYDDRFITMGCFGIPEMNAISFSFSNLCSLERRIFEFVRSVKDYVCVWYMVNGIASAGQNKNLLPWDSERICHHKLRINDICVTLFYQLGTTGNANFSFFTIRTCICLSPDKWHIAVRCSGRLAGSSSNYAIHSITTVRYTVLIWTEWCVAVVGHAQKWNYTFPGNWISENHICNSESYVSICCCRFPLNEYAIILWLAFGCTFQSSPTSFLLFFFLLLRIRFEAQMQKNERNFQLAGDFRLFILCIEHCPSHPSRIPSSQPAACFLYTPSGWNDNGSCIFISGLKIPIWHE